jgi:GNAT superfamily N-acetyltransferase
MSAEEISCATLSDAAEILRLQQLAFQSEADFYQDQNLPAMTQTLAAMQQDIAQLIVLKLVKDGVIVASVRGQCIAHCAHISRLIVHPNWQGQGLGRRLMQSIEAQFKDGQRYTLFTGARSLRNIAFYQSLGYVISGEEIISAHLTLAILSKPAQLP